MRVFTRLITVVSVSGVALGATFLGASAGAQQVSSTVTIAKGVLGTAPAGTVFEVAYTCDVPADPASNFSGTVQFDATGKALGSDSFTAVGGTHCTVTETANGGATSVHYLCTDIPRANSCHGLQTTDFADFTAGNFDGAVNVTVQNEMAPLSTTTMPPVVVQPTLTG